MVWIREMRSASIFRFFQMEIKELPRRLSDKEPTCQCSIYPLVRKIPWSRRWQSCLENTMDRIVLQATVLEVTKRQTQLSDQAQARTHKMKIIESCGQLNGWMVWKKESELRITPRFFWQGNWNNAKWASAHVTASTDDAFFLVLPFKNSINLSVNDECVLF